MGSKPSVLKYTKSSQGWWCSSATIPRKRSSIRSEERRVGKECRSSIEKCGHDRREKRRKEMADPIIIDDTGGLLEKLQPALRVWDKNKTHKLDGLKTKRAEIHEKLTRLVVFIGDYPTPTILHQIGRASSRERV